MKERIIRLLNDYPDKEIAVNHIIELIKGILPEKKECKKDVLGCIRCGSCDVNSWNAYHDEVERMLDE